VLHALGRDADAAADLHRASDVLAAGGQGASAAAADLELAGLLAEVDPAGRDAAVAAARERAGEAGAGSVLAQVAVAEGLTALARGDAPTARERFAEAIEAALAGVDAATYIAAAAGMAEAAEADGDRVAAYRALASGWVTVSDLLGREVGAEAFRPLLQAARRRWGAAVFADVKAEHDRARVTGPRLS
jgi:hypothetical protein